jgi:hypothetical protein
MIQFLSGFIRSGIGFPASAAPLSYQQGLIVNGVNAPPIPNPQLLARMVG